MRRDTRELITDRIAMTSALRSWLCERLSKAVRDLNRSSEEHIFAYPPASYSLPDYKLKVKHPMDLETVARNIRDVYCSIEELEIDIELMVKNCRTYNGEGALYDTYGQNLWRDAKTMLASLRLEFSKQEKIYPDQVDDLRRIGKRHLETHPLMRETSSHSPSTPTPRVGGSRTPTPTPATASNKTSAKRILLKKDSPPPSVTETHNIKRPKREAVKPVVTTVKPLTSAGCWLGCNFIPKGAMRTRLLRDQKSLGNFSTSPSLSEVRATLGIDEERVWTANLVVKIFKKRIEKRDYYRDDEKKTFTMTLDGIMRDFEHSFCSLLLYPAERRIHESYCLRHRLNNTPLSSVYPVIFLVRFLALLPIHLQKSTDYKIARAVLRISQELLLFINKNWATFTTGWRDFKTELQPKVKDEDDSVRKINYFVSYSSNPVPLVEFIYYFFPKGRRLLKKMSSITPKRVLSPLAVNNFHSPNPMQVLKKSPLPVRAPSLGSSSVASTEGRYWLENALLVSPSNDVVRSGSSMSCDSRQGWEIMTNRFEASPSREEIHILLSNRCSISPTGHFAL